MLRRRGSAPAVVLQQHLSEQRGVLFKADRIIPPTDAPRLSKARRKKDQHECGCSPPPLTLGDRRTSGDISYQSLELYDSPSPKCPSPRSPDSPNLNKKPIKHRPKRRDSEPFVPQGSNGPANARNSSSSLQRRSSSFRDYNIVLLGQGGVGKSALLVRFTTGRFIHEYDPTLELTYDMCYEVDEEPAVLHITDTASANEPFYLSQNEGFIVVYAIDEPRTFQTAKQLIKLIRELKKQRGQHTAIVLVGNKVDLNHSRSVSNTEALEFASKHECFFHETSAANNINVKVVFQDAVRQLRLFQLNRRTNGPMNSLKNFFSR